MASESVPTSGRWRPTGGHRGAVSRPRLQGRSARPARVAPTAPVTRVPRSDSGRGRVVLDVQNLRTYFFTYDGVVRALEGINLQARAGETTGVVGETGCGKSVTAFSVARLVSEPGRVISGKILLNGVDLLWGLDREARYRRIGATGRVKVSRNFGEIRAANQRVGSVRGRGVGMIFQEPTQAMNPVFSISDQLGESLLLHRGVEILDGLLRADRVAPPIGPIVEEGPGIAPPKRGGVHTSPEIEQALELYLNAAAQGDSASIRSTAADLARRMGLPSVATELVQYARTAGKPTARLRRMAMRSLRRVHLGAMQRRYIRHLRRVELLRQRLNGVYLEEMKLERHNRVGIGAVRVRMRLEKLRHFYFGIRGIKRRMYRPLRNELFWRTVEQLEQVRIANPAQVARGYPHELSGGMLQRAMIAMALSCQPTLLLADEPTTALDVTIQAQILDLMRQLRESVGTAIVLITHDLGVVAEVCDHVNVMYAGIIVENGPVTEVFRRPLHPYTHGLLASIPRFDQPDRDLQTIPGAVPNLIHPPPGCRFHPRCPYAMPICKEVRPEPQLQGPDHLVACHLYGGAEETSPAEGEGGEVVEGETAPADDLAEPLVPPPS